MMAPEGARSRGALTAASFHAIRSAIARLVELRAHFRPRDPGASTRAGHDPAGAAPHSAAPVLLIGRPGRPGPAANWPYAGAERSAILPLIALSAAGNLA